MRSFLLRLAGLIAAVLAAQVLIVRYAAPLPEVRTLDRLLGERDRIIFFGDSSVLRNDLNGDADKSSIPQMLARMNPGYTVGNLGHPGYHLGVYEAEVDYIARAPVRPEAVVIPIQLRSFSPEWDMRPVNQFEKERFFLTDRTSFISYFYTPLAILRAIDVNTVPYATFLDTPVYDGTARVGTANDFEAVDKNRPATDENVRRDYVYKYMGTLDPHHRKLESLRRLIAAASKAGVRVYAYIGPVDYESGARTVGPAFRARIAANAAVVCGVLRESGTPCLDLSLALGAKDFDHPAYPNEHLFESGRAFVADQLSRFFLVQ